MRKLWFLPALGLFFLAGCNVSEMSTLKDVSKPYVGEYRCEVLDRGGEDLLGRYRYVKLELSPKGTFRTFWKEEGGAEGEYTGEYAFEGEKVALRTRTGGREVLREFPYHEGKILLDLLLGEELLHAEFSLF